MMLSSDAVLDKSSCSAVQCAVPHVSLMQGTFKGSAGVHAGARILPIRAYPY